MMFGPPGGPPPIHSNVPHPKRPKGIKNVIPFWIDCLKNMIKRLVYIYKLVWDARPALMFILAFMAVFNGVQSIIGAYISKMLLDGLQLAVQGQLESLDVYKRQILRNISTAPRTQIP